MWMLTTDKCSFTTYLLHTAGRVAEIKNKTKMTVSEQRCCIGSGEEQL